MSMLDRNVQDYSFYRFEGTSLRMMAIKAGPFSLASLSSLLPLRSFSTHSFLYWTSTPFPLPTVISALHLLYLYLNCNSKATISGITLRSPFS